MIVKLLTSEIWFDGRILALSVYVSGKFLSKRKTSIALQLLVFVLPKPYVDLHDTNLTHMCLVALSFFSNFVTLVRCLSYLLDQDHVHSTSWTSTLEVNYAISSIHKMKTPCLMISLSLSYLSIEAWAIEKKREKRWHAQEAWPKKKLWTQKVQEKINKYSHIAMSSCYPNKRERDS